MRRSERQILKYARLEAKPGALVRAISLTRTFGSRAAVSDLSLAIEGGEILALLGPNGAGKTTTLRMLAGLIMPTSGVVEIHGTALTRATANDLRRCVGLLTETPGLWDRLSVRLNLLTYARLYNLQRPADVVERALGMVGLTDRAFDAAGTLSKGLRQRVALARALLHDPPIVLLDEPTAGLDPASARHVRDLIAGLRRGGRAILVSTHNLAEAEELATRIAVLNTRLLALDAPSALRRQLSGTRVEIEVEGPADRWIPLVRPAALGTVETSGSELAITIDDVAAVPDLVAALVANGARVRRVDSGRRTLEDVYLALVGDTKGAA